MVRIAAAPRWRRVFCRMIPQIVRHAKFAFRRLRGQDYQDTLLETIANALVAFVALVRRGKINLAYPTALAKYAAAQVKDGRRVGSSLNGGRNGYAASSLSGKTSCFPVSSPRKLSRAAANAATAGKRKHQARA